jgi:polyphosphate glucokinase
MTVALGIDIGGTGIKGALVDTTTGELVSERIKLPTPDGGKPEDVAASVLDIIATLGGVPDQTPVGICFPAIVRHGTTLSAANVSSK